MKIPAHWAHAEAEAVDERGRRVVQSCWRSSDVSQEDAWQRALAAAQRMVQSLVSGQPLNRYPYASGPLREQVLDRILGSAGDLTGVVTQNSYGSLVLSTERVLFIDLDFPPTAPGESVRSFFRRLVRQETRSSDAAREQQSRELLDAFLRGWPQASGRIYRTYGGLRVMATHALFDPAADSTRSLLEKAGCDPLYVRLCRAQQSFRARLTPKPWRCGQPACTISWPRSDAQQQEFEDWQRSYAKRQERYATCRLLACFGRGEVHPEAAPLVELHDRLTRAGEPLELA